MDLCRTCGQFKFSETLCNIKDPELMIESKLKEAFNVQLAPDQVLPQQICFQCVSKVENSFEFFNKVKETQANLYSNLSVQFCDPAIVKTELFEGDEDIRDEPTEFPHQEINKKVKKSIKVKIKKESSQLKQQTKISRIKQEVSVRRNRPISRIKVENIFSDELVGVFEESPDFLNIDENARNPDGSLAEVAELGLLGWNRYEWKCEICMNQGLQMVLKSSQDLDQHFKNDHNNDTTIYSCMDCKFTIKNYFKFQNHVIEHQPHLKFCCDVCNVFRWNLVDLYKHRQEHHPKFKNTCLYCGKVFEMGFLLKQHVIVHQKFKPNEHFCCDLCPFETNSKSVLQHHITYGHAKAHYKQLVCEQCGKVCKTGADMRSHMLVHSDERPHGCDMCHLKFKCPKQLKCHKRIHFPQDLKFECEICRKKFLTKSRLTRHAIIHNDEYQFSCEFCGRKFKHDSGFNTHRRIHTGERPYVCPVEECGQKFIDWPNMNKHCKTKHSIDNSNKKHQQYQRYN